ncbi:MAG: sucrose synthase, partial [Coleofasciculus sp. Co-bin14]|nr:sucrose synthase [Coleofasciculus sp. Co-bin14]
MLNLIQDVLDSDEKSDLRQFASHLRTSDKKYLLRNDILTAFSDYCTHHNKPGYFYNSSNLGQLVYYTQEIILENESLYLIIRPKIASQEIYRILEDLTVEPVTVQEILDLRDRLVNRHHPNEGDILELDFHPFYDYSPTIRDPKNIGKGVSFLNRFLSSKLFQDPRQWLESLYQFLSVHQYQGTQLLINGRIKSQQHLSDQVKRALLFVSDRPEEESYEEFRYKLQEMGFEAGWGNTAYRVRETLEMLDELIDSPDHEVLERFLSRIPMIFRIVLVSIHGWFGQEGVLG